LTRCKRFDERMVFKTGSMLETAGAVDNALLLAEHQVDIGQEVGLLLLLLLFIWNCFVDKM